MTILSLSTGKSVISKYQSVTKGDSLYRHNNGQWTKWLLGTSNTVKHFESTYGKLLISFNYFVKYYDQDFTYINGIYNYNGGLATPSDAIFDKEGIIWIADNEFRAGVSGYKWEF
jgi:hypothetical protein